MDNQTFFFSSALPQNPSPISANFHVKFPIDTIPLDTCGPVRGLVYGQNQWTNGRRKILTVYNPSTGQVLTLPEVETMEKEVISYFGYDPINKQFKVLCMMLPYISNNYPHVEHQVLTLGTGKELSWRMIKCDVPHSPERYYNGMCINGVFYYFAWLHDGFGYPDIVCFDISTEKFKWIRQADDMKHSFDSEIDLKLVNYKGKLGKLQKNIVDLRHTGIMLWVLKDAEKREWSKYIYVWPADLSKNIANLSHLQFVGTTSTGEIVLSTNVITDSFYLLYYSTKANTITRVEVQGMEALYPYEVYTFLDHVEDMKLMENV